MKDQDGFYVLTWTGPEDRKPGAKPKITKKPGLFVPIEGDTKDAEPKVKTFKAKKLPKPKLKKRWMKELYRKMRNWHPMKQMRSFADNKVPNFTLYVPDGGYWHVDVRYQSPHRKFIKDYKKNLKACHFIDCGDGTYMKISTEAYLKLLKVDRMVLQFKVQGAYDEITCCEKDDIVDLWEHEYVFTTIGELCSFINYHRQLINGFYDIQQQGYGFFEYWFDFRIVVQMLDGTVQTYHSDMNDFMKDFDLRPF